MDRCVGTFDCARQMCRGRDGKREVKRVAREIAHAVLYRAADESAMVTSHTFAIDGGLSG